MGYYYTLLKDIEMKNILILIIFVLVISTHLYAQDFTKVEYFGVHQPIWSYISYDSNFVNHPFDPYSSHYSGKITVDIKAVNNQIIILEQTVTPANFLGLDGCMVHSINKNSGLPNWVYSDNYYSGKRHREYFLGSLLNINQESGEVSFSSIRDNSHILEDRPGLDFTGRPSKRIISLKNGNEISNLFNDDLADTLFYPIQNLNGRNSKSTFFAQTERIYRDTSIQLIVRFYEYEQGCENFYTKIDSFIFDTGINEDFPPLASTPWIDHLDGEKLKYLFYINNPYQDTISIEKMYLKELAFEDGRVREIASIDMSDLITFPNYLDNLPRTSSFQGHTFITQIRRFPNWDEYFMFAWYDQDYNQMSHILNLKYNDKTYYNIYPISVNQNELKFFSQNYNGNLIELTLFSHAKNSNTLDSITSIVIDTKGKNFGGIFDFKILGVDEIILQTRFSFDNSATGRTSNYMQYSLFEMPGYGITKTIEDRFSIKELKITPNPTHNLIKIECEGIQNSSIIQLYDQRGQLVKEMKFQDEIDVSDLRSGMYYLRIMDNKNVYEIQRFVKI